MLFKEEDFAALETEETKLLKIVLTNTKATLTYRCNQMEIIIIVQTNRNEDKYEISYYGDQELHFIIKKMEEMIQNHPKMRLRVLTVENALVIKEDKYIAYLENDAYKQIMKQMTLKSVDNPMERAKRRIAIIKEKQKTDC